MHRIFVQTQATLAVLSVVGLCSQANGQASQTVPQNVIVG
jgi:hypothetical protein